MYTVSVMWTSNCVSVFLRETHSNVLLHFVMHTDYSLHVQYTWSAVCPCMYVCVFNCVNMVICTVATVGNLCI